MVASRLRAGDGTQKRLDLGRFRVEERKRMTVEELPQRTAIVEDHLVIRTALGRTVGLGHSEQDEKAVASVGSNRARDQR